MSFRDELLGLGGSGRASVMRGSMGVASSSFSRSTVVDSIFSFFLL
jgi:hypothetical protein